MFALDEPGVLLVEGGEPRAVDPAAARRARDVDQRRHRTQRVAFALCLARGDPARPPERLVAVMVCQPAAQQRESMIHAREERLDAEGVEDLRTREMLQGMGCDQIQGYYLSRPLPPEQLGQFLGTVH